MRMLVVCLPTYNERENVERMTRAVTETLTEAGLDGRVLVIDDASPDGTGELADRLAEELEAVQVLHRERKEGLGPAYLAGFRRALDMGAEQVVTIDCDFSHDPRDLPRLVAAASDADRPRRAPASPRPLASRPAPARRRSGTPAPANRAGG